MLNSVKVTSDDGIRFCSRVEIPSGINIECEAAADGRHTLSFGGWLFGEPRLVLDLHPGAAGQILGAVKKGTTMESWSAHHIPAGSPVRHILNAAHEESCIRLVIGDREQVELEMAPPEAGALIVTLQNAVRDVRMRELE